MIQTALFAAALLLSPNLWASKYHWKFSVDLKEQSLGDGEQRLEVGDWTCTIGEAKSDKPNTEERRLGCGIGKGLQAYLSPICHVSKDPMKTRTENNMLRLQMNKSGSVLVALRCE